MAKVSNRTDDVDGQAAAGDEDDRLDRLAARFLELWREQVAATADGAQAASAIGRLYASLGADTTRMGEGFEAWGNLIGQMAMGQHGDSASAPSSETAAANPLMAMMAQLTKAAQGLPVSPFAATGPFAANMTTPFGAGFAKPAGGPAASADPSGTDGRTPATATASVTEDPVPQKAAAPKTGKDADNSSKAAPDAAKDSSKQARGRNAAKGQGKDDQSTTAKTPSAKKGKPAAGGAKAASDAYGGRDDELAQLARRIADLSETIAALEAGTEGTGKGPSDGD